MTTSNNKKAAPAGTGTASKNIFNTANSTAIDPLLGWHELSKLSRALQKKKAGRSKKGGGR